MRPAIRPQHDIAAYVADSRRSQGLPEKIEDPATVEQLAVLIAARREAVTR